MSYTSKTIVLDTPITHGKEEIVELVIARKPTIGDLRGLRLASDPTPDDMMEIASRITGQPLPVIRQVALDDFAKIMEVLGDFFPSILTTGQSA